MAVHKQLLKGVLAGAFALMLSGCVTVIGPISGTVDGKIGNTPYKFMLMQVTGYKRWHITQQIVMPPQPIDPWFYGARGWPYGGYGGWGWYNPGPAQVQTIVTE